MFLRKVCGLNKKTAAGLVALREQLGRIHSREEIKGVKGLGAKSFEQCAGRFLLCAVLSNFSQEIVENIWQALKLKIIF